MLKLIRSGLPEVIFLEYSERPDPRGQKYDIYDGRALRDAGIENRFVIDTIYRPRRKRTFYGIHFQNEPKPQTKLVCCLNGHGMDYVVDLRRKSPTYKQWVACEISGENRRQVLVPPGFGHAFLAQSDDVILLFRIDIEFDQQLSRSIAARDPEIALPLGPEPLLLSSWDEEAPLLRESDCNF